MPTQLHVLRGNPAHAKLNKDEPKPDIPPDLPEPPPFLEGHARDEWWRIAEQLYRLRLLTVVDLMPLAAYCHAYGQWRTASEVFQEMSKLDPKMKGFVIKTKNGNAMQNPLVITANKAASDMVRYAAEFGFTPAARSRISAGPSSDGTPSKFAGLLAG